MTKSKLDSFGNRIRKILEEQHEAISPCLPLIVTTRFVPPGLPLPNVNSSYVRYDAFPDNAPNGYLEAHAWDPGQLFAPVGRAVFLETRGLQIYDCLVVDQQYRGQGVGRRLIETGERFLGGQILDTEHFTEEFDDLWWSNVGEEPIDEPQAACDEVDLSRLSSAPCAHLSGLSFECQGAFVSQR